MSGKMNRGTIKRFFFNRKINTVGLVLITLMCLAATVIFSVSGFRHADVLVLVTLILVILCVLRMVFLRSSFKTIRTRLRRKKP